MIVGRPGVVSDLDVASPDGHDGAMLPPPQTPPPPAPRGPNPGSVSASRFPLLRYWPLIVALMVAAVVYLAPTLEDARSEAKPSWRFEIGICSEDGYSGRFYNLGDNTVSGSLWATASIGGTEAGRDYEVIANLPPGESEGVEFSWVLDQRPSSCAIDGFDPQR